MKKFGISILALGIAYSAFGQVSQVLYAPTRSIKDQDISVKSWGSGTVSETDEAAFEGSHSIRVSTRNLFQGGIVQFGKPMDLARTYEDKNNLLRITYQIAGGGTRMGGVPGGGFPGGGFPGGPPGTGFPGAGGPGGKGFPGAGGPGGFGGGQTATPASLKTIRLIVTTTDGLKSEAYLPTSTSASSSNGWKSLAVPLQAISGFDRTNKTIKEVGISGDATTTFYLGDLRVVNDSTPISGEARSDRTNLALGDEVNFSASGTGGASILVYSWDFDDKDGVQVDAEGPVVKRRFRTAGDYTVTLTVGDKYGLKPPYSTKLHLVVNP